MKQLICLFCLLVAMTLACGVSAPSQAQTTPLTGAIPENTATLAPEKPANKAKIQAGYTSTVTADLLNIRTAPMGAIIPHVWLMEGESVTVLECRGVWGRIGSARWINTLYLERSCE